MQAISTLLIWKYTVVVQLEGTCKISNKPGDVVERICSDISGSGRNITIDNWFTSYELIQRMLNDHRCTVVKTLRKNKGENLQLLSVAEVETSILVYLASKKNVPCYPMCRRKTN